MGNNGRTLTGTLMRYSGIPIRMKVISKDLYSKMSRMKIVSKIVKVKIL